MANEKIILETKSGNRLLSYRHNDSGRKFFMFTCGGAITSHSVPESLISDLGEELLLRIMNSNSKDFLLDALIEKTKTTLALHKKPYDGTDFPKNVLNKNMEAGISIVEAFSDTHFLVGGTAIALLLKHRESIDFDLFSNGSQIDLDALRKRLKGRDVSGTVYGLPPFFSTNRSDFSVDGTKMTLMDVTDSMSPLQKNFVPAWRNPVVVPGFPCVIPNLTVLAGMKICALGDRMKNKDYYDLWFLLNRAGVSLEEAIFNAMEFYGPYVNLYSVIRAFNDPKFRETEDIVWLTKDHPSEQELFSFFQSKANAVSEIVEKSGFTYWKDENYSNGISAKNNVFSVLKKILF